MPYLLGIDVSTTATKALLIDDAGRVVAVASSGYEFDAPRPLWSEQEPALWWEGAQRSIRQVLADAGITGGEVTAVGLTGQMHGLVLLDDEGHVLRPAILWNDQRTHAECDALREALGRERLIELTGNDALTGFTLPKLLWVKQHEPEYFARVRHVLLPKDFLRFRLTGTYATDRAGAGGTLLLDLRTRDWSPEVAEAAGIPMDWLPPTHEGPEITGHVSATAARLTGLREGTPVVAGGGDQAAGAVGMGAVRAGVVAITLGTSGVVFASTDSPSVEAQGRLHAFPHAVPGRWHLMGVTLSAAGSLRWYRDTFAADVSYETLFAEAAEVPPGSDGLLFLPYLTGERTPYPDPHARGAFVGLTVRHTRAHLTRAVLEGVAFSLRDVLNLLDEAGLDAPAEIRVSGGGARSPLWRQILADVLGVDLVTVGTTEGAAFGAALLAGTGVGVWPSVDAATDATVTTADRTEPDLDDAGAYGSFYKTYRDLYPALRDISTRLSRLEEQPTS